VKKFANRTRIDKVTAGHGYGGTFFNSRCRKQQNINGKNGVNILESVVKVGRVLSSKSFLFTMSHHLYRLFKIQNQWTELNFHM